MLRSDLHDYNDAYIVLRRRISATATDSKKVIFKNNAPFRSCISKINNRFVDNAEDLNIIMPMYNLLEYRGSYSITCWSLQNYYRDGVNNAANENENNRAIDFRINNYKTTTSKSFEYKTKLIGSTPDNASRLNTESVCNKNKWSK